MPTRTPLPLTTRPVGRVAARRRSGQSTVEYVLMISVIAIAAVFAAQTFVPGYQAGLQAMQDDVTQMTRDGVVAGS